MSQTDLHNFNIVAITAFMIYSIIMSCVFVSDCSKVKLCLDHIKHFFIGFKLFLG
jgi:hypothetical protein